jgi:hypothetical protein
MKPKYNLIEFKLAKANEKLMCQCYNCNEDYYVLKKYISYELKHNIGSVMFCSKSCAAAYKSPKEIVTCINCSKIFYKLPNQIKRTKNNFCSLSCSTTYNNKHKSHGNRRSKLEKWIETEMILLYPNIDILFNNKNTIGSELDIYIPSLNLAFEINGIFHYEPIYGVNKFNQILFNDVCKSKACHDAKIDLCVINTSEQTYFKISTAQKYLDIINNIIKERALTS